MLACILLSLSFEKKFEILYDDSKPHTSGTVTEPSSGSTIGDNPSITVSTDKSEDIDSIDFIGCYEDF